MAKFRRTKAGPSKTKMEFRLLSDEPKSILDRLKALIALDLAGLLGLDPRASRTVEEGERETVEIEADSADLAGLLPNEPLETQLREGIQGELAESASEQERRALEAGTPEAKKLPAASPDEELDKIEALARRLKELRDEGWEIEIEAKPRSGADRLKALTPREAEVLYHVGRDRTTKEIAELLGVTTSTINRHTRSLMQKLAARDRDDVKQFAIDHGLTEEE